MTQATFNGHVYSDDGSAARDMQGGGVRNWLLPMLSDAMVEIDLAKAAQTYANAAATSATDAANYAAALSGTSATALTVATGAQTLTTQTGKQFTAGQYVMVSRQAVPGIRMWGTVTSYNSTTGELVFDAITAAGSGSYNDWQIGLSGEQGEAGPAARAYVSYKNATYTVSLADIGNTIDCTGSWTLGLTAAATLGDGYYVWVRNAGSGTITIDPSGAETIDGVATYTLNAGHYCQLLCDGSNWRVGLSGVARLQVRDILADNTSWVAVSSYEQVGVAVNRGDGVAGVRTYWTGSLFLSMGLNTNVLSTSPDGLTWTSRTLPALMHPAAVANIGANVVIVQASTTAAARSTDGGVTWSSLTLPAAISSPITIGVVSGLFVMTSGDTGTTYYTSPDGLTWTARTNSLPIGKWTVSAKTCGGLLFAMDTSSPTTTYCTSPDGLTWTARTLPAAANASGWRESSGCSVADAVARFVASDNWTIYQSVDGINWTSPGLAPASNILPVQLADGMWLAHGTSDYLLTASAITGPWTRRGNATGANWASNPASNNAGVWVVALTGVGMTARIATDQTVTGLFTGV